MTRTIRLRSRSHSLVPPRRLSLSGARSALINNAYPRARTGEKSTAVATRGTSPRTPAIAHTYLYTVIFKMKERRADGYVVVVRALTLEERRWEGPCGWSITFSPGCRRSDAIRCDTTRANERWRSRANPFDVRTDFTRKYQRKYPNARDIEARLF